MKLFEEPKNANYAATVVRLPKLLKLEGADRLLGAPLFGFQALVGLDNTEGDLGIVFGAETQLSEDFAKYNDLYSHQELNANPEAKGYLGDNRRVRAIKLRGHRSDCLWLPITCLGYLGLKSSDYASLKEGDTFDALDGKEICRKYVIKTKTPRQQQPKEKRFVRVDPRLFVEHVDTENYWRNAHLIAPDEMVTITAKLHGTSVRLGRTHVLRRLTLRERIAKKLGVRVEEREWAAVAGSRKVVKDPIESPSATSFYASDVWGAALKDVEHLIPEGWLIFGELCGWVDGATPIQKDYQYDQPPGTRSLWVYRIATVNPRGVVVDLSWPQVKQWRVANDIKHVPELWIGRHADFIAEDWIDRRFHDDGFTDCPQLANKKLVDEGVVVRAERLTPVFLKAKSPIFLGHETALLDKEVVDIESEQSESEDAA